MTEEFSNDRLEAVLRSIGNHLEIPPQRHAEPASSARARRRERSGRILAVAATVAVVATGVLLVPSARSAVADLLGIGSTRIEITGEEAQEVKDLPHIAQGLTPISIDQATRIVGRELPDMRATILGPPEAVYQMPEGGVLLAWRSDAASLWVRSNTDTEIIFAKLVGSGQDIETVDDLGTQALLITDTHILQTPQRRLSAKAVLLWQDDTYEYRLEADLAGTELVDLARSIP